ncbi:MAG: hypothetical protein QOD06_1236, partial [Candidatus Binatota bacterium]|nr:hypothetical protein [Candidatus Binatota bacterium]
TVLNDVDVKRGEYDQYYRYSYSYSSDAA